jgi:serine/threonine-protein kinase
MEEAEQRVSTHEFDKRAQGRIGTVLRGKYRLDRVLGVGGMAVVYTATHRNQKQFAVKMLHPELSLHEDIKNRFLREGYAANSVKHPGAVAVLDDDVADDGAAFLVMELLEGSGVEELWERLRRRMPVRATLAIAYQLLDVLAAAHAKAIVHRDIKPANLFLVNDGTLKVLDFGIARVRDAAVSGSQATGTGMLLGTPAFMAPEQALAKASEIDGQTDLWAVGATLFSLLSGQLVHEGENAPQLMVKAATSQGRSVSAVTDGVPPGVVDLIDRAIAFDKAARWPSAIAMRDAVRDVYGTTYGQAMSRAPLAEMFEGSGVPLAAAAHAELSAWSPSQDRSAPKLPMSGADSASSPVALSVEMPSGRQGDQPHVDARGASGTTRASGGITPPLGADLSTSKPVSSDAEGALTDLPRRALWPVPVLAGLLTIGGIGLAATRIAGWHSSASSTASAATAAVPPPTTETSADASPPSAPSAVAASSSLPSSKAAPSAESSTSTAPAGAPASITRRKGSPQRAGDPTRTSPAPSAPLATPQSPVCPTVAFFDSEGNRHFKEVCP